MRKQILLLNILLSGSVFIMASCQQDLELIAGQESRAITKTVSDDVPGAIYTGDFEVLPSPFELENMQAVHDSLLGIHTELQPTDLYVRFLPDNAEQMETLLHDLNLELFDYPLNLNIAEGEMYIDPTLPEGQYTWQYTAVKSDFVFPSDIRHEILKECYMPSQDNTNDTRGGETVEVVDIISAAFRRVGYPLGPETRGWFDDLIGLEKPSGKIEIQTPDTIIGVKKVKVRCHIADIWFSTAYTNELGEFEMDSALPTSGVHYAVVFDNAQGFDIWGNWGPLARANLNLGTHGETYSHVIGPNSQAWPWAAVNNAGYDYYMMCEDTEITKPPSNTKIWVDDLFGSSAPMFRRVIHPIGINGNSVWVNFFSNIVVGSLGTLFNTILKPVEPDITINPSSDYSKIYNTTNHELSHASHFSQVGGAYWAKYISYIGTYGSYGNGTGNNAELVGIGEMWGYAMGEIQEKEKYSPSDLMSGGYPYEPIDNWIHPHVFWDLITSNVLTKKQIYDCLTSDVDTYSKLIAKMYAKYPTKVDQIQNAFVDADIIFQPTTSYFTNQTVTSNWFVTGDIINVQNVSVRNGAKLTLNAKTSISFEAPFTVESGSLLEVTTF